MLAFLLVVAGWLAVKAECAVPLHASSETMACCEHGAASCDMGTGSSSCCDQHLQGPTSQAAAASAAFHADFEKTVTSAEIVQRSYLHSEQRVIGFEPASSPPPPLVLRV